jgi:hypothetical protein
MKTSEKATALKNRIVSRGMMDPAKLKAHPMNFRMHPEPQRKALEAVLSEVGWVQDVIVNKTTGNILNGHLRVDIAKQKGEKVPTVWVNLTEAEERMILAVFDPIGGLAVVDDDQLAGLLAETTFKSDDLTAMIESLLGEAKDTTPHEAGEKTVAPGDRLQPVGYMGDAKAQIKPVLYAKEIAVFEDALRLTGEANRAAALIQICQFYIEGSK